MLAGMTQLPTFLNICHHLFLKTQLRITQFLVGLQQISKAYLLKGKMQIIENK